MILGLGLVSLALAEGEPTVSEHGEAPHERESHRAFGVKLIDLVAFNEERTTSWLGLGLIAERPISKRVVVEVAVQGLFGAGEAEGFAIPLDLLLKRVWFVGDRTVLTVGGGPALTVYREPEEAFELFPGALASLGGSYWLGPDNGWGILAEVDFGGSIEPEGLVPELELATGVVFAF